MVGKVTLFLSASVNKYTRAAMLSFIMKVSSVPCLLWLREHLRKVSPYGQFLPLSPRHYYHLVVQQVSFLVVKLSVFKANKSSRFYPFALLGCYAT